MEVWYSVEWVPKDYPYNCWNQYTLTSKRWRAYIYLWEARMNYGTKKNYFRVRAV